MEDIKRNYEHLLVKLMAGVMNEIQTNKQEWIKPELEAILVSLEHKLERKIERDVEDDLTRRLQAAGLETAPADGSSKPAPNGFEDPSESALKQFMKNCLGLIKCLQYQGDISFETNGFYRKILEGIGEHFDNKNEVMREYSNAVIKVIQSTWDTKGPLH